MDVIDSFSGKYFFLSNFYHCTVTYKGLKYFSSEAAYQAQKVTDPTAKAMFTSLNPTEAKSLGQKVNIRDDWNLVKEKEMLAILREKFKKPELAESLRRTGSAILIEGNDWGDTYWGVCRGFGQNRLGELLMHVRSELKASKPDSSKCL